MHAGKDKWKRKRPGKEIKIVRAQHANYTVTLHSLEKQHSRARQLCRFYV